MEQEDDVVYQVERTPSFIRDPLGSADNTCSNTIGTIPTESENSPLLALTENPYDWECLPSPTTPENQKSLVLRHLSPSQLLVTPFSWGRKHDSPLLERADVLTVQGYWESLLREFRETETSLGEAERCLRYYRIVTKRKMAERREKFTSCLLKLNKMEGKRSSDAKLSDLVDTFRVRLGKVPRELEVPQCVLDATALLEGPIMKYRRESAMSGDGHSLTSCLAPGDVNAVRAVRHQGGRPDLGAVAKLTRFIAPAYKEVTRWENFGSSKDMDEMLISMDRTVRKTETKFYQLENAIHHLPEKIQDNLRALSQLLNVNRPGTADSFALVSSLSASVDPSPARGGVPMRRGSLIGIQRQDFEGASKNRRRSLCGARRASLTGGGDLSAAFSLVEEAQLTEEGDLPLADEQSQPLESSTSFLEKENEAPHMTDIELYSQEEQKHSKRQSIVGALRLGGVKTVEAQNQFSTKGLSKMQQQRKRQRSGAQTALVNAKRRLSDLGLITTENAEGEAKGIQLLSNKQRLAAQRDKLSTAKFGDLKALDAVRFASPGLRFFLSILAPLEKATRTDNKEGDEMSVNGSLVAVIRNRFGCNLSVDEAITRGIEESQKEEAAGSIRLAELRAPVDAALMNRKLLQTALSGDYSKEQALSILLDVLLDSDGVSEHSYREGQSEVLGAVLASTQQGVLAGQFQSFAHIFVAPTGTGKSLVIHGASLIGAVLQNSGVIVILPTLGLIHDFIRRLPAALRGVEITSNCSGADKSQLMSLFEQGLIDLIATTPEQVCGAIKAHLIRCRDRIAVLALDEAHCISEWGHNFRPEYLSCLPVAKDIGIPAMLAVTATATSTCLTDLEAKAMKFDETSSVHIHVSTSAYQRANLELSVLGVFHTRAEGPDCSFEVVPEETTERYTFEKVVTILAEQRWRRTKNILVYVWKRYQAEQLSQFLSARMDGRVLLYHSGLLEEEKTAVQREMTNGHARIVVCTMALGIGIHQTAIEGVLHLNMPKSLEQYVQETGRCSRAEGSQGVCSVILHDLDYRLMWQQEAASVPDVVAWGAAELFFQNLLSQGFENGVEGHRRPKAKGKAAVQRRAFTVKDETRGVDSVWLLAPFRCVKRLFGVRSKEDLSVLGALLDGHLRALGGEGHGCFCPLGSLVRVRSFSTSIPDLMETLPELRQILEGAPSTSGIHRVDRYEAIAKNPAMFKDPEDVVRALTAMVSPQARLHVESVNNDRDAGSISICLQVDGELDEAAAQETSAAILSSALRATYEDVYRNWRRNMWRLDVCYTTLRIGCVKGEKALRDSLDAYFRDEVSELPKTTEPLGEPWPSQLLSEGAREMIWSQAKTLNDILGARLRRDAPDCEDLDQVGVIGGEGVPPYSILAAAGLYYSHVTVARILCGITSDDFSRKDPLISALFGVLQKLPILVVKETVKDFFKLRCC